MPEVKGRTARGSTAYLQLEDDGLTVWEERGLYSKRRVKAAEHGLDEIASTELEKGHAPHRSLYRLLISSQGEEQSSFYSSDMVALEAVKTAIDTRIEERRAAEERMREERRSSREAHLNHITLLLELLDNVFRVLLDLDGSIDWGVMAAHGAQLRQIDDELQSLPGTDGISVYTLSEALRHRTTGSVKEEAFRLIETVRSRAREASARGPDRWFNLGYYEAVVEAYLLLWDLNLAESLGQGGDPDERGLLQGRLRELVEMMHMEGLELVEIEVSETQRFSPQFGRVRSKIFEILDALNE